ncbi:MAG: hypothetical protein LiPW16_25 [Microgenomates group bacterium LiPW_16]|nr:MAG: hypothetical protein LiPW16_25 [Microgenomates group bacterium LiPW_16]
MIPIKTKEEIEKMKEGGKILAKILEEIKKEVKSGITTLELDKRAEELIKQSGGKPSFKMVKGYKWITCMCVNEVVVHGVPGNYKLKEGDVLGIDIGLFYKGFHTDMAWTLRVQTQNDEVDRFLEAGKRALEEAIKMAKVGNYVGHVSQAIQETIEKAGFSPVRALVGHGVGRNLHEEPQIPCFLRGKIEDTPKLKEGMTLAIEIIYNQGKPEVVYGSDDGWTIKTADGKLSGLFEHTVAVLEGGPEILTLSLPKG